MKKLIIFDFDGTIVDSKEAWFKAVNKLAPQYNYTPIKKTEIKRLRNKTIKEIMHEKNIAYRKLPFLLNKLRKELENEMQKSNLYKGIKEVIANLNKNNIIAIITSNSEENTIKFLNKHKIKINFIYGGTNIFGKAVKINRIMKKVHPTIKETYYIGDEVRDIKAAKKTGIKSIAVTWGFNSKSILKKANPNYIIGKPKELIKIIN